MTNWKTFGFTLFISCISLSPVTADSLFNDLGGMGNIQRIANITVDLSASNPKIKHFFEQSDLVRTKKKLAEQFCQLSGGPCNYTGAKMDKLHKPMGISTADFYALVEDLQEAMDQLEVPPSVQNRLIGILASMHRDIVE